MEQQDLWQSHARCTGLTVSYRFSYLEDGLSGFLGIAPQWSKRPRRAGELIVEVDEHTQEVLPQLAMEAFSGFLTTDPGYFVPRRVKNHLQNYQDATSHQL